MKDYDTNTGIDANAASERGAGKDGDRPRFNSTLLAAGAGIVLLGCLLFLQNISGDKEIFGVRPMYLWPIIIVAIGAAKLAEQRCRRLSGWLITLVGGMLLWHSIVRQSLDGVIGPAVLICVGVFIVLCARRRRLSRMRLLESIMPDVAQYVRERHQKHVQSAGAQSGEGAFACGTAIASAYRYRPNGGDFCGGDVVAIFGGFEMDLSRMVMKSDTARIDVFVLLGGGEIRVPEDWDVSVRTSAIGGGVEDKTICPPSIQGQRPKLLIVTGFVMLGGLTVKPRPYK